MKNECFPDKVVARDLCYNMAMGKLKEFEKCVYITRCVYICTLEAYF